MVLLQNLFLKVLLEVKKIDYEAVKKDAKDVSVPCAQQIFVHADKTFYSISLHEKY